MSFLVLQENLKVNERQKSFLQVSHHPRFWIGVTPFQQRASHMMGGEK